MNPALDLLSRFRSRHARIELHTRNDSLRSGEVARGRIEVRHRRDLTIRRGRFELWCRESFWLDCVQEVFAGSIDEIIFAAAQLTKREQRRRQHVMNLLLHTDLDFPGGTEA